MNDSKKNNQPLRFAPSSLAVCCCFSLLLLTGGDRLTVWFLFVSLHTVGGGNADGVEQFNVVVDEKRGLAAIIYCQTINGHI